MNFGENLKRLRKYRKMSQEDLAEKVGVSRQSVSKWETSDAYPEMNNILELCKIFHCNISELVNDSIIDIDLLDDEVKENAVKFKKDKQEKMKTLTNFIVALSKIGKIVILIAIPIVCLLMFTIPFLVNNTNVEDNKITFNGISDVISIDENGENIVVKLNDTEIARENDIETIVKIKEIFVKNSKVKIICYLISGSIFLILTLVLMYFILKNIYALFKNINENPTPFTLENVEYIKRTAYLMIITIVVPNIAGVLFEMILKMDLNIGFEMFDLIEILFVFSIAYIFEYGYELQLDSNGKMYGDVNE